MRLLIRPIDNNDDLKYIIESHWRIYKQEYGYDYSFKNFITQSLTQFTEGVNSEKEHIWLVDIKGIRQGSIGIVDAGNDLAQLRWFLIEPQIRGMGYGNALMDIAIRHCLKYYKQIILWTNSNLIAARKIYERHGFELKEIKKSYLSNQEIMEEKWTKSLN